MKGSGQLSSEFKFNAISWKCQETGLSYGKLRTQYSTSEIEKIYEEYQEVLNVRSKARNTENKEQTSLQRKTS